jgi:hypothetical protein
MRGFGACAGLRLAAAEVGAQGRSQPGLSFRIGRH